MISVQYTNFINQILGNKTKDEHLEPVYWRIGSVWKLGCVGKHERSKFRTSGWSLGRKLWSCHLSLDVVPLNKWFPRTKNKQQGTMGEQNIIIK